MNNALNINRRLLVTLFALAALLLSATVAQTAEAGKRAKRSQAVCVNASASPSALSDRQEIRTTNCLINAERRQRGLAPLRLNKRLSRAARGHARDMVRSGYFSHDSRGGGSFVDRIRRSGYLRSALRWSVGENLAWGSGDRATPREIVKSWMRSPGHRANILTRNFREIGIGVVSGAPVRVGLPAATYATDFGTRR